MTTLTILPILILSFMSLSLAERLSFRGGVRAAYWPSYSDLPPSSIDTSYFTHVLYAFLLPDPSTYKLALSSDDMTKIPQFIDGIRTSHPHPKTLVSIGGGASDPTVFAAMAGKKQTREVFINSTIEVARRYGFDGVDLDWEFPADDQDMSNLASLFKEWREAISKEGRIAHKPRLLLTSAVYYASKFTVYGNPRAYPAQALAQYLDWASPMCFDYHGSWANFTGYNAALFDPNSNISTNYGIGSWIKAGVPPNKLVMGLPLYGRTWKLQDPKVNGVRAPAVGAGPGDGVMLYYEIVDFNAKNKATVVFDRHNVSYYSYAGDSWIGYDDVGSITRKVKFARSRRLLGYFFWAIGQDKNWTITREASRTWLSR